MISKAAHYDVDRREAVEVRGDHSAHEKTSVL